jgi:hypothetical protein
MAQDDDCWDGLAECLRQKSNYINFKECYLATCVVNEDEVSDSVLR